MNDIFFRCGYLTMPPGAAIVRTSSLYELTWMDEGASEVSIDGVRRQLTRYELALCPPGVAVEYRWTGDSIRLGYILFQHPIDESWARFSAVEETHFLPHLLRHLLWLQAARPPSWAQSIATLFPYVLDLWAARFESMNLRDGPRLSEHVHRAVAHVANSWSTDVWAPPRLDALAEAAGVTPDHLVRLFTAEVGAAPLTAFRRIRLFQATMLLRDSNMNVTEIAHQCGYANPYHFSAAFKKALGVSPRAYRMRPIRYELSFALQTIARYLGGGTTEQDLPHL